MNLFEIEKNKNDLLSLEKQTLHENFWNDQENSTKILSKIDFIKTKVNDFNKIKKQLYDVYEMNELVLKEFDEDLKKEVLVATQKIENELKKLELKTFLSGKYDLNNAIITIHPRSWRYRISRLG